MLAQSSTVLALPPTEVVALLIAPEQHWRVALDGDGREQLARVGVRIGAVPVYKHIELSVGQVPHELRGERVMLPVHWETAGGPPIFPRLDGTLHVEPEGPDSARLTLNATYDPPFGRLGELLDRALMARLAQATLNDFLDRLAGSILAESKA